MLKNNTIEVKPAISALGFKNETDSVRISKWPDQTENHPGSGYNMFDSQQAEVEPTNRSLIRVASRYATQGEEFHWMVNAAYNQSK